MRHNVTLSGFVVCVTGSCCYNNVTLSGFYMLFWCLLLMSPFQGLLFAWMDLAAIIMSPFQGFICCFDVHWCHPFRVWFGFLMSNNDVTFSGSVDCVTGSCCYNNVILRDFLWWCNPQKWCHSFRVWFGVLMSIDNATLSGFVVCVTGSCCYNNVIP